MNKKFNSLSLTRISGHLDLKENSKLKVQPITKAENKINKSFQILSQDNNIIEWKADQQKEIRIIC